MDHLSLQFQGTRDAAMLAGLLAVAALAAFAFALWQWLRGRRRYALLCLAAAFGPATFAPALVLDAVLAGLRGDRAGAKHSGLAAAVTLVLAALAGALVAAAGNTPAAWWTAALAVQLPLVIGVFYAPAFASLGLGRLSLLLALRYAAVLALLAVLFKPALAAVGLDEQAKPVLPVLLDRSGSMSAVDRPGDPTRFASSLARLNLQSDRLARHFRPVFLSFARHVAPAKSAADLARPGPAGEGADRTDIALAIREAVETIGRDESPGILLLSDGIHNAPDDALKAAEEAPVPLYVAAVGSPDQSAAARPNAQLLAADVDRVAILNNVAKVTARLQITAMPGRALKLALREEGLLDPVAVTEVSTAAGAETITRELSWTPRPSLAGKPAGPDLRKLVLTLAPDPIEATPDDNRWETHVLVTQPRIRVLYVEGTIRPEYAPLKRCLDSDPNVQFASLVRYDRNSFEFQGRSEGRPLADLPTTPDDFKRFDVIIMGDLDATFWTRGTPARLANLKAWVDAGGGLLMIGGRNTFAPGGYAKTVLADLMPVEMAATGEAQERTPFVPKLTASGRTHPIFEGIAGYFPGPGETRPDPALRPLEELRGCVRLRRAKPGADLLAVHPTRANEAGPLVVLAAAQFGQGRTAAFAADTTWVWDMPLRDLGPESPYQRFWGQMVRWLANISAKRKAAASAAVLRSDAPYAPLRREVALSALVHDRQGRPLAHAPDAPKGPAVRCTVSRADDPAQKMTLDMNPTAEPGVFSAKYTPARDGKYTLALLASDEAGPLGSDELSLLVAPHQAEMANLARDDRTLRKLADAKGGLFAESADLGNLLSQLIERQKLLSAGPEKSRRILRLYDFTALFLLFTLLLTAEWLLRRRWQLR